jgi:hypothetical protein
LTERLSAKTELRIVLTEIAKFLFVCQELKIASYCPCPLRYVEFKVPRGTTVMAAQIAEAMPIEYKWYFCSGRCEVDGGARGVNDLVGCFPDC